MNGDREFGFVYRVTLRDRTNPPARHQESSDLIRNWFKSNGVLYGMGALGGMRIIYGTIDGRSEQQLSQVREEFSAWLLRLPACGSVSLGVTRRLESLSLAEGDWERTFEVDNLTWQDRNEANTYYTELAQWVEDHAKKPAGED